MNAIETHGLSRSFGQLRAVEDLTLAIPAGSVFGFLGPNGAGKTTTVRMLAALIAPTSGTASVLGHRLGEEDQAIRGAVGILTETPGLYEKLSAFQNLVFFARLYDVPRPQAEVQAERYLRMLGLWARRDNMVGGFSKGMRQKLAIARALLHEPALVFLDEPTAGLDPEAARTVRDFIKELRAEGRTNLPDHAQPARSRRALRPYRRLSRPAAAPRYAANLRAGLFGRGTLLRLAGDPAAWAPLARELPFVRDVAVVDGALSVGLDDPDGQNPALVAALVAAGAQVRYVEPRTHSLEDVYLELIGEGKEGKNG